MTVGSLFSGIGAMDYGLACAGFEIAFQVEQDPYCRRVLARHWPEVERHGDIRGLDGRGLPRVGLLAGGPPCQPVSLAGQRRGTGDERWLWPEFARLIRELRPRYVLVENVPGILIRGGYDVLGDLAALGYDAEWSTVSACSMGAPHVRRRVFVVAYPTSERWVGAQDPFRSVRPAIDEGAGENPPEPAGRCARADWGHWWGCKPAVASVAHGLPARLVGRPNRAIGNAVVPAVSEYVGGLILRHARATGRLEEAS